MNIDAKALKQKIKGKIEELINECNLEAAESLISQYEKIAPNDIEIYSIKSVIYYMKNEIDETIKILNEGLSIDNCNFDLLYNLALSYQYIGDYYRAIIFFRKARNQVFYDIRKRAEIDSILKDLYQTKDISRQINEKKLYLCLESIKDVLLIDFNPTERTNNLANKLIEYGVNVDLAYSGNQLKSLFYEKDLPYRKMLGILSVNGIIEYVNNYKYDMVHVINVPNIVRDALILMDVPFTCNNKLLDADIKNILTWYNQIIEESNKEEKNIETHSLPTEVNISIVIPTYNRPECLNRILNYFNNFEKIRPKIYVLDSSHHQYKEQNKKIIEEQNNITINYNEFNDDINFFEKLNFAINKIETEFIALCADDDFLTEEGIEKSIQVLQKKEDLFSVKGKNLFFIKTMSKLREYDFFRGLYDDDSIDRLNKIVEGFFPSLMYQVFRTDKFRRLCNFITLNKYKLPNNNVFLEYLFYFMVVLTGKIEKINLDLNIRDKSVPRGYEFKNFPHSIIDKTFNKEYNSFKSFLREYCMEINIEVERFEKEIDKIFSKFLINFLHIPDRYVKFTAGGYDLNFLEEGMRKSWVWPKGL